MSSEHGAAPEFPYRREDVFKALVVGVDNLPGMRVESEDSATGKVLVEAGVTYGKAGQKYPVTVVALGPDRSRLEIGATSGRGTADPEKERATVEKIVRATSEALEAFGTRPRS